MKPNSGSLREYVLLALPIACLVLGRLGAAFVERILLARCSIDALQGAMSGLFLSNIFQWSCIAMANMSQVFVGRYLGAQQPGRAGPCIWQMLWFSLLSMIATLPASYLLAPVLLKGSAVEAYATSYFFILAGGNFLFPAGAALASFFLAQKQIGIIIRTAFIAGAANILLDVILIFGIRGVFPPLETAGAAWGALGAQLLFCALLLGRFLRSSNQMTFDTHRWRIDFKSLAGYLKTALPRMGARIAIAAIWMGLARIMTLKGEDYLLALSIGSALTYFFVFYTETTTQTTAVLASRFLGAGDESGVWKTVRSGMTLTTIFCGALAIAFVGFPKWILSFFYAEMPPKATLDLLLTTIPLAWLWITITSFQASLFGTILARKETLFYLAGAISTCCTSLAVLYTAVNIYDAGPNCFWITLCIEGAAIAFIYAGRLYWKRVPVVPAEAALGG